MMKKIWWVLLSIVVILALLCGSFVYNTKYKIGDIDAVPSPDSTREILFQSVGEPDWPFGDSHARIVLKEGRRILTRFKLDVANDGAILFPDNWTVSWQDDCVQAVISGEEQDDVLYTFYYDGTVDMGTLGSLPQGGS